LVFADDSEVRYVLPVLWMTSCFHISRRGKLGDASRAYSQSDSPGQRRRRSLMPAIALLTAGMHSNIDDDDDDDDDRFQIHCCQYGLGHLFDLDSESVRNHDSWIVGPDIFLSSAEAFLRFSMRAPKMHFGYTGLFRDHTLSELSSLLGPCNWLSEGSRG